MQLRWKEGSVNWEPCYQAPCGGPQPVITQSYSPRLGTRHTRPLTPFVPMPQDHIVNQYWRPIGWCQKVPVQARHWCDGGRHRNGYLTNIDDSTFNAKVARAKSGPSTRGTNPNVCMLPSPHRRAHIAMPKRKGNALQICPLHAAHESARHSITIGAIPTVALRRRRRPNTKPILARTPVPYLC